jgi:hypothetical protein
MNAKETLTKLKKVLLGEDEPVKQELERLPLQGGEVIVEIEGDRINVVGEDDQLIPAPEGQHVLEDGRTIVVREEGVIAEILEPEAEVEAKYEDKEKEVEMATEEPTVEYVTKADFDALSTKIETLLSKQEEPKEEVQLEAVELEKAPEKVTHSPEKKNEKELIKFAKSQQPNTKSLIYQKLF